jgi:hypothetical protein
MKKTDGEGYESCATSAYAELWRGSEALNVYKELAGILEPHRRALTSFECEDETKDKTEEGNVTPVELVKSIRRSSQQHGAKRKAQLAGHHPQG